MRYLSFVWNIYVRRKVRSNTIVMMTLTTLKYQPTRRVEEEMKVAQKREIRRTDKKS